MNFFFGIMVFAFFAITLSVIIVLGLSAGGSDAKMEMRSAMITVSVLNSVLILILGGLAYYYISIDGTVERTYLMLMTHMSVLFSIIAVSVSSLHQLTTNVKT